MRITLPLALLLVSAAGAAHAQATDAQRARATALLDRAPVVDGHNDLPWEIRSNRDHPGDVAAYAIIGRAIYADARPGKAARRFADEARALAETSRTWRTP